VARPEIVPFADEHLNGAVRLLAERHARHRQFEPLLPAGADLREQVERERGELAGVAAVEGGEVVGYLLGTRREDQIGPHVWSFIAGHSVTDPELVRDLYAAAAEEWVDGGLTRHFVYVPALPELVDPWFRLSFGASAALAIRETGPQPPVDGGVTVRQSTRDDVRAAAQLDRHLAQSMLGSPSFSRHEPPEEDAVAAEWAEVWDDTNTHRHFVAERGGQIVGHILLYRRPPDLRLPADSIDLADASTLPDERGSGVGLALTHHVLGWAHEHGYTTMTIDWRMTNLLASRFWPRRGFRETFLRLYRSIP
jgi:GNAT superfamily N-acetyltransferase